MRAQAYWRIHHDISGLLDSALSFRHSGLQIPNERRGWKVIVTKLVPLFSGRFPLHKCTVAETPSLISATIKFIICRYLGNYHLAELKTINFSYSKDGLLIHSESGDHSISNRIYTSILFSLTAILTPSTSKNHLNR